MSKFGHLQKLAVTGESTVDFVFYAIDGSPTLEVAPATKANKPFFNAVLKKGKEAQRKLRARRGQMPTQAQLDEVRRQDADLFVEYVVKGWRNVVDQEGEPVEFSAQECREFLLAIPEDMFEELRDFCMETANFRNVDDMPSDEQEELAGN